MKLGNSLVQPFLGHVSFVQFPYITDICVREKMTS